MKNVTLSVQNLLDFGVDVYEDDAPLNFFKLSDAITPTDIYTCQIANWNDKLTVFPKSVPLTLSKNAEAGSDWTPTGSFVGRVVKGKRLSEKALAFSLVCYDKGSKNNSLWVDCISPGKTGELIEQYGLSGSIAVSGNFSVENHPKYGIKLKLFVTDFTLIGGGKKEESQTTVAAPANEEEIPF